MSIRSSMGPMLDRADRLGHDSSGNRIAQADRHAVGSGVMPVKETRHYAPAPCALEDVEVDAQRVKDESEVKALLTVEENAVREILLKRYPHIATCSTPVQDMDRMFEEGWLLVKQENGMAYFESAEPQQSQLSYEQIGHRVGLSAHQVHRRVTTMNKKLRGMR